MQAWIERAATPLLMAAAAAVILATGPLLLSDAPAHMVMANVLLHAGDPGWPMLNRVYAVHHGFTPNLAGELLLAGLLEVLSPGRAEQVLQILCVAGVPASGWLLLRTIRPGSAWLAVFLVPLGLQRYFYLGLYNYCLSVAGCLLAVGAFLAYRRRPSAGRLAALAALLLATIVCQVSGWIAAMAAIGTATAAIALLELRSGLRAPLRWVGAIAVASLPGALLFLAFLAGGTGGTTQYGDGPGQRLVYILRGLPLDTLGALVGRSALLLSASMVLLAAGQSVRLARSWRMQARPDMAAAVLSLPVAFLVLVLIIPDSAGGAWGNVSRMLAFPYVGAVAVAALLPLGGVLRAALLGIGGYGAAAAIAAAALFQAVQARPALDAMREIDRLVGPHCTVVPVFFQYKLDAANTAALVHHPLFHIANRMDLRDDRVVLFSYVARLSNYPVQFRPDANPHDFLFHWAPDQTDTLVQHLDIANFERRTGIPIDFVLIRGPANPRQQALWDLLHDPARADNPLRDYRLVHRSADGPTDLYRRILPGGCAP